ncbi:hypothetical protein F4778DRAFT_318207 [Xylariomycetidae sp. FL2044]|nr:hypothetical protein F4778DRAFT_318207 [Xylariomycetidae sp. FL2044]
MVLKRQLILHGSPVTGASFGFGQKALAVSSEIFTPEDVKSYLQQDVTSIWIFCLPLNGSLAINTWKLAFELANGKYLVTELLDTNTYEGTYILLRPLTDVDTCNSSTLDDFMRLCKIKASMVGRPLKTSSKVSDILKKLHVSGLMAYQLRDGRGNRHWILSVVTKLKDMFKMAKYGPDFPTDVNSHMQNLYNDKGLSQHPVSEEIKQRLRIQSGIWVRKWVDGKEI